MADQIDEVPAVPGRLIRVRNQDRPVVGSLGRLGANFYYSLWVENAETLIKEPLLFTEREVEVARQRARKNAEDVPRIPVDREQITGYPSELEVFFDNPRLFPNLTLLFDTKWHERLQIRRRNNDARSVSWTLYESEEDGFLLREITVEAGGFEAHGTTRLAGGADATPPERLTTDVLNLVQELHFPAITDPTDDSAGTRHNFRFRTGDLMTEISWTGAVPKEWQALAQLLEQIGNVFESEV